MISSMVLTVTHTRCTVHTRAHADDHSCLAIPFLLGIVGNILLLLIFFLSFLHLSSWLGCCLHPFHFLSACFFLIFFFFFFLAFKECKKLPQQHQQCRLKWFQQTNSRTQMHPVNHFGSFDKCNEWWFLDLRQNSLPKWRKYAKARTRQNIFVKWSEWSEQRKTKTKCKLLKSYIWLMWYTLYWQCITLQLPKCFVLLKCKYDQKTSSFHVLISVLATMWCDTFCVCALFWIFTYYFCVRYESAVSLLQCSMRARNNFFAQFKPNLPKIHLITLKAKQAFKCILC